MKIAMIGAGAFGGALGGVLAGNGHEVDYYDPQLDRTLDEVLKGAGRMVLCVPSGVVEMALKDLPRDLPLIVATKGVLGARVFSEFLDVMVLSGPGFAEDIKACQQTRLTATDERVIEMFTTDYLDFDMTDDVEGVLLCGALKNVYALLAGWLGLVRESAEWEQFITEVAEEMQALISMNGGKKETVQLACGIGDLRLTCGLPSRNYEFGQMLKKNPEATPDKTVEGWTALMRIVQGVVAVPEEAEKLKFMLEQNWGCE